MTPAKFRALVWRYYRVHGRHDLPWRNLPAQAGTTDVYRILVSEVMLQQTQVERVVPFYTAFIKKFPTAKKLAAAPLSDVLKLWQGLGYNRRAKMLHQAAKQLAMARFNLANLQELPGVGPYTARAVAAFAWNSNEIVIETNIRTVVIHHFFPASKGRGGMIYHTSQQKVSDTEIEKILTQCLPKGRAREWYSALMDYGAYLKRSGISHNARTRGYAKQKKFTGSLREARGGILRELAQGARTKAKLTQLLGSERREQMQTALTALLAEKMIEKKGIRYTLAN